MSYKHLYNMAMKKMSSKKKRLAAARSEFRERYGARGYVKGAAEELGVSMQSVSNWLNGRNRPNRASMMSLRGMGLGLEELF